MKFQNYLDEAKVMTKLEFYTDMHKMHKVLFPLENLGEYFNLISKKCMPYLKEWIKYAKTTPNPEHLYSGRGVQLFFIEKTVRKNRRPKDTPDEIQKIVDDAFYKKFKVRPRSSSFFTTPIYTIAEDYGEVYAIFPQGNYKIIWSPDINDFFSDVIEESPLNLEGSDEFDEYDWKIEWNTNYNSIQDKFPNFEKYKEYKIDVNYKNSKKMLKDVIGTYIEGVFSKAIKSKNEIMLMANKIYGIRLAHYNRFSFSRLLLFFLTDKKTWYSYFTEYLEEK